MLRTAPTCPTPKSFRLAPLVVALAAALPAAAATFTVTSTADSGAGTLRQAIMDANAACSTGGASHVITFPGSGPFFMNLNSPLPTIQCAATGQPLSMTIDGTSRATWTANNSSSGWNANAEIQIDGFNATFGGCGIGAFLYGGTLTVTGVRMTNWLYGGNAICASLGPLVVKGSLISGNSNGISLASGFTNTIGGGTADRNVIIANSTYGISGSTAGGSITNNLIGIAVDGVTSAGNGRGINVGSTGAFTISGNYIGNNSLGGMQVTGGPMTITGNKIGNDTSGNAAPNGASGIRINSVSPISITGNVISHNSTAGIEISAGTGVSISQNSIYAEPYGIMLGYGGAINDAGDVDSGPNTLQNWPQINGVTTDGANTQVSYSFTSAAGTFILEFFDNPSPVNSEGKTFVGSKTVTVPAGVSNATHIIPGIFNNISATARNSATGDTSEFSFSEAVIPVPAVTVNPTAVNFGNVPVGSSSAPRTITYTSSGAGDWEPYYAELNDSPTCYGGTIAYGGAFMLTSDCDFEMGYSPGNGCSVTATFAPSALGPYSAYLCIFDNSDNGFSSVSLAGNSVVPPTLTLLPSAYDFGGVSVRTTSPPARFILRNPGSTPVDFTTSVNPPFAIDAAGTSCRSPINPGTSCNISATFTPPSQGSFSEPLAVTPSAGTTAYSQLMGSGVVGPNFAVPNSIEFVYALGNDPTLHELRLTNTGTAPLTFDNITVAGPGFTLQNPCPSTLAPDESCVLTLGFTSATTGQVEGSLTINSNAPGGQRVVRLFGLSQTRPVPLIDVSPREMSYGARAFGTVSPSQRITIRNVGGAPAIINSIVPSPDYVIVSTTCTTTLAPLTSCTADVSLQALSYGQRRGTVVVIANDERSPHSVSLLGTSCRGSGLILGRLGITTGCQP
ncbi:hypothetical protein DSM104443_03233 [Usitatibacter rugosus]|uniref:Uncharacterized protein n=1 Tax=Usitatibacter rugosus TaxID=2732067 RepID=A0A6M4GZ21_9PROT|nr:choice-of-anchor D domain-containing protein [Usitatibacter rugosus]QJR12148.1 hypothetical protein DSM104443_03233 [Usitatibacter rugosus]